MAGVATDETRATAGRARAERTAGLDLSALVARTATRMVVTLQWLSVFLAAFTVFDYLLAYRQNMDAGARLGVIAVGVAGGAAMWAIAALAANHAVLPEQTNPRSYADLRSRMLLAEAEIGRINRTDHPAALDPVEARLAELRRRIGSSTPDPGWSTGIGYVIAWRELHRIEEALITCAGDGDLEAVLAHDELRVEGSRLARKDSPVRPKIDRAREKLGRGDTANLRPLLQEIREAVNDFRDRRFEALVRSREDLDHVSTLLGVTICALLFLAILMEASDKVVASVAAFYLVGVGAGLFTQLRGGGSSEALEDIYGYGRANVRRTVLLSGLAAVIGVGLSWVVAQGADASLTAADIEKSLTASPTAFLEAAVFGLAPGMLIDRLNAWAKTSLGDLQTTRGGEPGPAEPAGSPAGPTAGE